MRTKEIEDKIAQEIEDAKEREECIVNEIKRKKRSIQE